MERKFATKATKRKLRSARSRSGKLVLQCSFPSARSRQKCFWRSCFEHVWSLAQGLGPNKSQNLIPNVILTNMHGPKMLQIECLSQALRISISILFEFGHFPSYGLNCTGFSCNGCLKGTFSRVVWLKGIVSRTAWLQSTFSRSLWFSELARVLFELNPFLMYFLA